MLGALDRQQIAEMSTKSFAQTMKRSMDNCEATRALVTQLAVQISSQPLKVVDIMNMVQEIHTATETLFTSKCCLDATDKAIGKREIIVERLLAQLEDLANTCNHRVVSLASRKRSGVHTLRLSLNSRAELAEDMLNSDLSNEIKPMLIHAYKILASRNSVLVGDHHASARAVQSSCNVTDKRRVIHKALRKKIEQLEHTYSAWCTQIESVMGQVAEDMEAIHIQAMTSKHVHGTSNGVQHKFNTMQIYLEQLLSKSNWEKNHLQNSLLQILDILMSHKQHVQDVSISAHCDFRDEL